MKKIYIKPITTTYAVTSRSGFLLEMSNQKPEGGDENQFSKEPGGDGMWDWMDDDE